MRTNMKVMGMKRHDVSGRNNDLCALVLQMGCNLNSLGHLQLWLGIQ